MIQRGKLPAAAAYDAIAGKYDEAFSDRKSAAEDRWIAGALLRRGLLAARTLDLGCGTGYVLDLLEELPRRYTGVDISPRMATIARKKYPGYQFVVDDMEDLTAVAAESMDLVISLFGSFSYATNPERVVDQVHRVLRPGGRFFVMAYGELYARRRSYVMHRLGLEPERILYRAEALERLWWRRFHGVRVAGVSRLVDALPEWMPDTAFSAALAVDRLLLGRVAPDQCYFLTVEGTCP